MKATKVKNQKEEISNPYRDGITIKGFAPAQRFRLENYLKNHKDSELFMALFNK